MWSSSSFGCHVSKAIFPRYFTQSLSSSSSSSTVASALVYGPQLPLTYLDGLPKPDPKFAETIVAIPRSFSGSISAVKERRYGRIPSIVFEQKDGHLGGNKRLISVISKQIDRLLRNFGRSFFLSRVHDLEVRPDLVSREIVERVRVVPRILQMHPVKDMVLNITFIRAPSDALLNVDVPLVFIGEDVSPGLKKGGRLNTIKKKLKFLCPADVIPPFIEVDVSQMEAGHKLLISDLKVHPALKSVASIDLPVCKIAGVRGEHKKPT